MWERFKAWLGNPEQPYPTQPSDELTREQIDSLTTNELVSLNQALGRQQDALRERRRRLKAIIDKRLGA